jgi:hypothetical protein
MSEQRFAGGQICPLPFARQCSLSHSRRQNSLHRCCLGMFSLATLATPSYELLSSDLPFRRICQRLCSALVSPASLPSNLVIAPCGALAHQPTPPVARDRCTNPGPSSVHPSCPGDGRANTTHTEKRVCTTKRYTCPSRASSKPCRFVRPMDVTPAKQADRRINQGVSWQRGEEGLWGTEYVPPKGTPAIRDDRSNAMQSRELYDSQRRSKPIIISSRVWLCRSASSRQLYSRSVRRR